MDRLPALAADVLRARGAVVLCGGRSSRMGSDKAWLPFGSETLLQRTVRVVSGVVCPQQVVVVAAADQTLPELPPAVRVVRDAVEYAGPLAGLAPGLQALGPQCVAAAVVGCDTPLLQPGWIAELFDLLGDYDAAIALDDRTWHTLPGVYARRVGARASEYQAAGGRSLKGLLGALRWRPIDVEELRPFDPQLLSLLNVNDPAEYARARQLAGIADDAR